MDAPNPTDPEVFLNRRQRMNVYTRVLDQRMSEKDWIEESEKLDEMIAGQFLNVQADVWYTNGYENPYESHQRNEVWKVKV